MTRSITGDSEGQDMPPEGIGMRGETDTTRTLARRLQLSRGPDPARGDAMTDAERVLSVDARSLLMQVAAFIIGDQGSEGMGYDAVLSLTTRLERAAVQFLEADE